jgi:hypothetical protein
MEMMKMKKIEITIEKTENGYRVETPNPAQSIFWLGQECIRDDVKTQNEVHEIIQKYIDNL